jgi:actin-like ATPase involved in cell morphogenesis
LPLHPCLISLGGIVKSKNLRVAGDKLNNDIVAYIRSEFKILIGEKTAEEIKIGIGSAVPMNEELAMPVKGRDCAEPGVTISETTGRAISADVGSVSAQAGLASAARIKRPKRITDPLQE